MAVLVMSHEGYLAPKTCANYTPEFSLRTDEGRESAVETVSTCDLDLSDCMVIDFTVVSCTSL